MARVKHFRVNVLYIYCTDTCRKNNDHNKVSSATRQAQSQQKKPSNNFHTYRQWRSSPGILAGAKLTFGPPALIGSPASLSSTIRGAAARRRLGRGRCRVARRPVSRGASGRGDSTRRRSNQRRWRAAEGRRPDRRSRRRGAGVNWSRGAGLQPTGTGRSGALGIARLGIWVSYFLGWRLLGLLGLYFSLIFTWLLS